MEDALLAGSPNNTGRGGNNTPDDGRFLGSKSFDLGEEEAVPYTHLTLPTTERV